MKLVQAFKHKSITCLLFALFAIQLWSQDDSPAFALESRSGATLAYKVNKKLELSLEEQVRFKSVGNPYDQALTELNATYKLIKRVRVGLGYRFISRYDDEGKKQGHRIRHRFQGRAHYKIKQGRSEVNFRGQYQYRISRDPETGEYPASDHKVYWRFKSTYTYDIRKWKLDPELGAEFFTRELDHAPDQENLYRLFLATAYNLPGPQRIKIKYFYENALSCNCLLPIHTLAVNYQYTFGEK